MRCPSCGSEIPEGGSFCGRCGRQVSVPRFTTPQLRPKPKTDDKVVWIVVIVVVAIIVIPIVLSAALYFMVVGFGGENSRSEPPATAISKMAVREGERLTFVAVSYETTWNDVTIFVSNGLNTVSWSPSMASLTDGAAATWTQTATPPNLGNLSLSITVVDLAGNGLVSGGDYFTLMPGSGQSFSPSTDYVVTLIHVPTAMEMCNISFTG